MNPYARRDDPKIGWKQGARLVARTIGLVAHASRRGTATLAVLTLAVSVLPLAMAWVGKEIVDAVVQQSRDLALRWVAIELGIVVLQALAQRSLALTRELLGERLSRDVNVTILEKAVTLEVENFEDGRFYDRLTRARQGASHRPLSVVTEGFQLGQNLLTLLGYLALIVSWSPWGALALLAAAIPAAFVEMRFSRSVFRLNNWRSPESRQLNYLEYVLSNVHHVKEVKLFGLSPVFLGRYRALYDKFYAEDSRLAVRRAAAAFALALVATAVFYGCYASVALAAARGSITLGSMTLYLVAFRQGQQAFQSVLGAISGMYEDVLYMSNLFEYLGFEPRTSAAPSLETASEQGIRFEDVGFRYPAAPQAAAKTNGAPATAAANGAKPPSVNDEKWALRHVSFFVPRGQSIALVGENGAGKTTIVKLLTRLYEPTEGRVLLDGKDLRAWDRQALEARLAVIFQDFNEYQLDLNENIGLGSVPHLADKERIERASRSGGADAVIATLDEGLATRLGKWAHDGVELSGGQWQKIALARAFMREEADILVLDEPTASLDARAEHEVFQRFRALTKGRTTFLISHRFSTVRMADRILVLEHGSIIEDGSHEELLAREGRYAGLFKLQADAYR
jgi:ATP-binding cassette subfamily B protein